MCERLPFFMRRGRRAEAKARSGAGCRPTITDRIGEGRALLQGIVLCGLCGSHMSLHYEGGRSDHLVYICEAEVRDYGSPRCQQVRGLAVDAEVERLVLIEREAQFLQMDRLADEIVGAAAQSRDRVLEK
jgi:hypothetical protein